MAKALRSRFIHDDGDKGWSGPIAASEADDKWQGRLASIIVGIGYEDWRVAAVLSKSGSEARIGFADGDTGRLHASAAQIAYRQRGTSALATMKHDHLIPVTPSGTVGFALPPTDRNRDVQGTGCSVLEASGVRR